MTRLAILAALAVALATSPAAAGCCSWSCKEAASEPTRTYITNTHRQIIGDADFGIYRLIASLACRWPKSPIGYTRTQAQLPSHGRKSPTSRHQGRFPASPRGHVTDLQVTDLLGRWWFGAGR